MKFSDLFKRNKMKRNESKLNNQKEDNSFSSLSSSEIFAQIQSLYRNGQHDKIKENINNINFNVWRRIIEDYELRNIFFDNSTQILQNVDSIKIKDIEMILTCQQAEDFFSKNIQLLPKKLTDGIDLVLTIRHIMDSTSYGKKLIEDNQVEFFKDYKNLHTLINFLEIENMESFIKGISENIDSIIKNDEKKRYLIPQLNEILILPNLSQEEKEEKEEARKKIVQAIKDNFDDILIEEKGSKNEEIRQIQIEVLKDIGVDEEFLDSKQSEIMNSLTGNEYIKYIQQIRQQGKLPSDFTLSNLVKRFFADEILVVNDLPTLNAIEMVIQELADAQGINSLDVSYAGRGGYSNNLKIGEFVLKTGNERVSNSIQYHRRILRPIIRQQTNPNGKKGEPNLFIEVQNLVDADWYKNMGLKEMQEVLYTIYAELRDRGIYWTDVKPHNEGRLLKDNTSNLFIDGQEIIGDSDATGMKDIKEEEPLKKGDYVIIDTDFIYSKKSVENDEYCESKNSLHKKFEDRYLKEREAKIEAAIAFLQKLKYENNNEDKYEQNLEKNERMEKEEKINLKNDEISELE